MKWTEVIVKTASQYEDIVSHILYEAGAQGLAIEDPNDVLELSQMESDWYFVDINLMDFPKEGILIKAYYPEERDIEAIVAFIREEIEIKPLENEGLSLGKVMLNQVDDEDWAESWKRFYKPTKVGENIVIKPSWEKYKAGSNELVVELDPGMAFGTGTHETTNLCIEALEAYVKEGNLIYDIGCGSGILSIVAAKLGAGQVIGIDLDATCVKVSKENIRLNKLEDKIDIKEGNLLDVVEGKADLIVANIIAEIIKDMVGDLPSYLNKGGHFISSGIILDKVDLVKEALLKEGFEIKEIKTLGEWACIIAQLN
ncbi:MAG TPA: 50S ribosomal protein L11 methyltransferase [Tissierellaceae bacterium]|nr:50S ribosomal protein L11 methyltransferase [Tissierellaceae bacterium]